MKWHLPVAPVIVLALYSVIFLDHGSTVALIMVAAAVVGAGCGLLAHKLVSKGER
jgi:UDP-N-acetylmuramyl pentapeptide phosphotransferase/UDP-N-acetylglucosamine-1-phosphate transferase